VSTFMNSFPFVRKSALIGYAFLLAGEALLTQCIITNIKPPAS
jgi:hypothetical protein